MMARKVPTRTQLELLSEVIGSRPDLRNLGDAVALGQELDDLDADRLEGAIHAAFIEELDDEDEPSRRGRELDELLGIIAQLRRGYYDTAE